MYACSITHAAAESRSPLFLDGECPASRSSLSASTVENRSSWACTGTAELSDSARMKSRTARPCGPSPPLSDNGSPTTIAATSCSRASAAIAARSSSRPARRMAASGLTIKPVGSLTAAPMRLAPTSSPRSLRTAPPARLARHPPQRGWHPAACPGSVRQPGPGPRGLHLLLPSPWPPHAPVHRRRTHSPQRPA